MLETKSDDTLGDDKSILSRSSSTWRQRRWVDVRGGRLEEHWEGRLQEQDEEGGGAYTRTGREESPRRFAGALCCSWIDVGANTCNT